MSNVNGIVHILREVSIITQNLVKCQAEYLGRRLQEVLMKILGWVLVLLSAILLALGGLWLILYAVYLQLGRLISPAGAAYVVGGFLFVAAFIVYIISRNIIKD